MARDAECSRILRSLKSLFPGSWLEDTARETGWVQRARKVDPTEFFWTVVLGFGCGKERSIAGLRRQFEQQSGETLVPSSFYDRFTPALVEFLRRAVQRGCESFAHGLPGVAHALGSFRDVVGLDATVLRLHRALAGPFPGTRTNHSPASAKLHVVLSLIGRGPRSVKVTDGATHELSVRFIGRWVRDRLLLFDLGYYSFQAFSCIDRHGGYFVTRLKDGANPELVEVLAGEETEHVRPGARLQDVLRVARRGVLDVMATLNFRRRVYKGRTRLAHQAFRVVALRDADTGRYHVYLTNVPADVLTPEEVVAAYSARWTLEVLFKELKSHYRVADLPSSKQHVVEALILVSVLSLLASRRLLVALARRIRAEDVRRLRPLRWTRLVEANARALADLLLHPARHSARAKKRWLAALTSEALDPNVSRWDLRDLLLAIQPAT